MKKAKRLLMGILLLSTLGTFLVGGFGCNRGGADITSSDGLVYELSNDGTYYIVTDYYKQKGAIIIPDEYNGLPVKEIAMSNRRGEAVDSISIPASVTKIREDCTGNLMAKKITVDKDNAYYSAKDGNLYNKDKTELIRYASGSDKKSFSVPSSVSHIASCAFLGSQNLEKVDIKDSVKYIGAEAFYNCRNLKFEVYENALYLGNSKNPHYALVYAMNYKWGYIDEIGIHGNTEIIEDSFWNHYYGTIEVDEDNAHYQSIDGGLYSKDGTHLIRYAHDNDEDLAFTLPDSVKTIAEWGIPAGFKNIIVSEKNTAYKSIDGNLYTKDGKTLVQYAAGKEETSFTIPDHVESVGALAFAGSEALEKIEMGDTLLNIGFGAFNECVSLTSLTIPDSVLTINDYAFAACVSLTSLTIGYRVTEIGDYAFADCINIKDIVIPERVAKIGEGAFGDLYYWMESEVEDRSIIIGESVVSIGCRAFSESFAKIEASEYNNTYKSIDGNLYTKDGKRLLQYAKGNERTSVTIPDGVTCISAYAFSNCDFLQEIKLPNSVTSIGACAFGGCGALTSMKLPNSVTSIGALAFISCYSLTRIELSNSVETIGTGAFDSCRSLKNIELPDSVTSIGSYAFSNCESLTSIEIPDSVKCLSEGLFESCELLETVILPESLKTIEAEVFAGTTLKKIVYKGESKQWNRIDKDETWDSESEILDIECEDKTVMS